MSLITPEGIHLRVGPAAVARTTRCVHALGLDPVVRKSYHGSLPDAVARSLATLARRSRYAGVMLYPNSSPAFAAFRTTVGGAPYGLLARPGAEGELEVVTAYSADTDLPEFAAQPVVGRGTVTWGAPVPLDQAIQANRGQRGLYVVETDLGDGKGWRPLYIGHGNIVDELRRELRATNHVLATNPGAQFRAYVGRRDGRSSLSQQQIETTLLRRASHTPYTLANDNYQYKKPMLIPAGRSVSLRHKGTAPPYLRPGGRPVQTLSGGPKGGQGRQYESFALLPAAVP